MVRALSAAVFSIFSSIPVAFAAGSGGRTLSVNVGSKIDFWTLIGNVLSFLANAALYIAPVLFLVGVLRYTAGGVSEDNAGKGKETMKGVLIGFGVIIGAYSILRTVYYFLS